MAVRAACCQSYNAVGNAFNHIARGVDCGFAFIECQIDSNHSDGLRQCEYDCNLIKRGLSFRCFDFALQRLSLTGHMCCQLFIRERFPQCRRFEFVGINAAAGGDLV